MKKSSKPTTPAITKDKVVFLGAHPDDLASEMGTACIMAEKYEVHVIDFTHGERGCGEEKYKSGWTRKTRTAEETAVCKAVGAKLHWLEEIDGEAYACRESVGELAKLLKKIKPRAIIMHWPIDTHPDHVMTFAAGMKAIGLAGIRPEVYYHLQEGCQAKNFQPFVYVNVTSVLDKKSEIIRTYACQNGNEIAERKKYAEKFFGWAVGHAGEYFEAYAVMTGTVSPATCIFSELEGTLF